MADFRAIDKSDYFSYQREDEQDSMMLSDGKGVSFVSSRAVRSKSFNPAPTFFGFSWQTFMSGVLLIITFTYFIAVMGGRLKGLIASQSMRTYDAPPATTVTPTLQPTVEPSVEPSVRPTQVVPTGSPTTPMPTYKTGTPSFAPTRYPIKFLEPHTQK
jgi:hypothetical protein